MAARAPRRGHSDARRLLRGPRRLRAHPDGRGEPRLPRRVRETTAADAVPGFGYAFFADQTGCCQEEAAADRFAEMSAVTGPQVSCVSLVLSLIGTITGNRALAVPASAWAHNSFIMFSRPVKILARFVASHRPVASSTLK